jgi:hypothetical protein
MKNRFGENLTMEKVSKSLQRIKSIKKRYECDFRQIGQNQYVLYAKEDEK